MTAAQKTYTETKSIFIPTQNRVNVNSHPNTEIKSISIPTLTSQFRMPHDAKTKLPGNFDPYSKTSPIRPPHKTQSIKTPTLKLNQLRSHPLIKRLSRPPTSPFRCKHQNHVMFGPYNVAYYTYWHMFLYILVHVLVIQQQYVLVIGGNEARPQYLQ